MHAFCYWVHGNIGGVLKHCGLFRTIRGIFTGGPGRGIMMFGIARLNFGIGLQSTLRASG